jgi:hypothetical protein
VPVSEAVLTAQGFRRISAGGFFVSIVSGGGRFFNKPDVYQVSRVILNRANA